MILIQKNALKLLILRVPCICFSGGGAVIVVVVVLIVMVIVVVQ